MTARFKQKCDLKHINVWDAFKVGNPKLARITPRSVIRIVERIICQDKMNDIINRYINDIGVSFQPKIIDELNLKPQIEGLDNLPVNSRCFFAANHPFGIVDGLILTYLVGQKYGDLKAIGNDAFLLVPNLKPLIAAVNVYGRTSKEYVSELEKIFNADFAITHFPAGEVSRIYSHKIQDAPWQKSFISKAIKNKRVVIPIFFEGQNSALFYTIFRIRKWLHIKINFELILLPREMFKKRNSVIKVVIGKPIPWQTFDNKLSHYQWAQKVREYVYILGKDPHAIFTN